MAGVNSQQQVWVSDLLHRMHLGHEVRQQVLDAVLQRGGGGGAALAGALHRQVDRAFAEAAELYVAAVAGNSRADSGLEQVLDRVDDLDVVGVEELVGLGAVGRLTLDEQRRAGGESAP